MREYTTPGEVPVSSDESLTDALWALAEEHPHRPVVARRVGDDFEEWTTRRFVDEVRAVARGLIGRGVETGDRVAIYAGTRVEWTILDFAIWAAGGVTVPIYDTSSADQVEWIVSDADVTVIFIENAELQSVFDEVSEGLPRCEQRFVIEDGALAELAAAGEDVGDDVLDARAAAVGGDDLATIVYTSGTTGRPKGCVITHYNFIWDAEQVGAASTAFLRRGSRTLLFLPLANIFARVIQTTAFRRGVLLGYSSGIEHLREEMGIFHPDFLVAVPRVFEKVYNNARQAAIADGKGKIFDKAAAIAVAYSRGLQDGRIPLGVRFLHGVFDKLVYTKLRAAMGGNVKHAVSGGAALGERLGHFFTGIGVLVLEGYGLTESTAGASINQAEAYRIGSVGRPVPGASARVGDDGELHLKGGHIFQGYHNNPEATAEILTDDGWLRTGDLGDIDDDGFVRITGRMKEIIVTAGGKNVAPAVLEDRLRSHALVSQSMVVGDGRPFIAALITIDEEALATWAQTNDKPSGSLEELRDDEDLVAQVQSAVDYANRAVSRAESIRQFRILPQDFTVGDELSQKMSVKRHIVTERYADVIEAIYAESSPASS